MIRFKTFFSENSHLIRYGFCLFILLFILKWLQWKFLTLDNSVEIYAGLIAVFFTLMGIWLALQLTKTKVTTIVVEKEVVVTEPFVVNEAALKTLELSNREWEVLQLITKGLSNAEIGDTLCLSLSTIKTHASNVFLKMDVKSRTQAIEKAKRLGITP